MAAIQPEDDSDDEAEQEAEDFEDWINNLYGFMHMVNSPVPAR